MSDPPYGLIPSARIAETFRTALSLAAERVGATAPNPPVGCVLLDAAGDVLAVGAHERAGAPHAEAAALAACAAAGLTSQIHTALVTLEPCSHHGRTPPCVDALLATPVRAVWIGALDPHPRGPGAGVAALEARGVAATPIARLPHPDATALSRDAERLIAPFAAWARTGRPWVRIKTALDPHGSMIPPHGRRTFTSAASLEQAHRLRREADAVVTGSGCILADDPAFTVRLVPDHAGKRRRLAILDRRMRVPEAYFAAARERGLEPSRHDGLDAALDALGAAGTLSALVEAGPTLRAAIVEAGLWDEEVVFRQSTFRGEPDAVEVRSRQFNGSAAR